MGVHGRAPSSLFRVDEAVKMAAIALQNDRTETHWQHSLSV